MASSHAHLHCLENFLAHLLTQKAFNSNTKVLLCSGDMAARLPRLDAFGVLNCGPAGRRLQALTALSPHSSQI
jgi:hypothetical protein